MAYEKIGFNSGDVLKAEHLNHIEEELGKLSFEPCINLGSNEINKNNIEEIFANPYNYSFYNMDGAGTNVKYSSKIDNDTLLYISIDPRFMNMITALTIKSNASCEWLLLPFPSVIPLNSIDYTMLFSMAFLMPYLLPFYMFDLGNLSFIRFYRFYQEENSEVTFLYQNIANGSFIKLTEAEDNSINYEYIDNPDDLNDYNEYTISINSIAEDIPGAFEAIAVGKTIYFAPDSSYPGYKIPLSHADLSEGIAWFSTEMVSLGEGKSYTLLYAITVTGELYRYIKNPATGDLVLQ